MRPRTRIMYIEFKGGELAGPARIGRVSFNRTGKTISYQGRRFRSLSGNGFKANYFDVDTMEQYWISGCKSDGTDALYSTQVEVDEDVREEYWTLIRGKPELKEVKSFHCPGKYSS